MCNADCSSVANFDSIDLFFLAKDTVATIDASGGAAAEAEASTHTATKPRSSMLNSYSGSCGKVEFWHFGAETYMYCTQVLIGVGVHVKNLKSGKAKKKCFYRSE